MTSRPPAATRLRWLGLTAVASLLAACSQPAPSAAPAPPTTAPAGAISAPTSAPASSAPTSAPTTARGGNHRSSRGGHQRLGRSPPAARRRAAPEIRRHAPGRHDRRPRHHRRSPGHAGHRQRDVSRPTTGSIDYDDKLTPQPMLAESWDVSSDLTQIKLNLRKGVQFHTGREFTSDDVKYNLLRVRDPKVAGSSARSPPRAPGSPASRRPTSTPSCSSRTSPARACSTSSSTSTSSTRTPLEGPDAKTKIVGTGPFTFVEWVQGDHFTFTRNKNYWQTGRPYLDGVSIKVFKDAQAQIAAARGRRAGPGRQSAGARRRRVCGRTRRTPTWARLSAVSTSACSSTPACRRSTTRSVRQALNYALDRQRFADSVMVNLVGPGQDLPWPPQAGAAEPAKNTVYTFDLDKAKSLLSSAGVGPSRSTSSITISPTRPRSPSLAQFYQADLAQDRRQSQSEAARVRHLRRYGAQPAVPRAGHRRRRVRAPGRIHDRVHHRPRREHVLRQNWSHYKNDELANLVGSALGGTRRRQTQTTLLADQRRVSRPGVQHASVAVPGHVAGAQQRARRALQPAAGPGVHRRLDAAEHDGSAFETTHTGSLPRRPGAARAHPQIRSR